MQLEDIRALVREDLRSLDQTIRDRLASDVVLVNQVANYIIAGGGKVFCIDGRSASGRNALRRRGEPIPADSVLYALDAASGKVVWQTGPDAFGTWLGYSARHDVVLQAGSALRDRAGDEARRGIVVYRAAARENPRTATNASTASAVGPNHSSLVGHSIEVPDTRAWRLEQLQDAHPVVPALLRWRKAERIATTYGYRWLERLLDFVSIVVLARILARPGSRALPGSVGEAISTLRDDVDDLERVDGLPFYLLSELLYFAAGLVILLWVDVQVTLLVLLPLLRLLAAGRRLPFFSPR